MARYIDLEELEKRINENIKPDTPEEKALIEWCKDECIRQGYAMPTADVAPKSEVERVYYNLQAVLEERAETKQEIAREIFEEIEKTTFSFGFGVRGDMTVAHTRTIDDDLLSELKKKYTEGKDTNVPTSPKDEFAKMLAENWKWGEEP